VAFGDAPIVPGKPGETLRRQYGDCKDKSTLLAAMLRDADIPAYLALLRPGPGPDVEPDLPGIGVFSHAIVHIPGDPVIWIDPTHGFARAGELPIPDQDRWALVARPESTGLIRTPAAAAADNWQVETREFFLSELGTCRVTETTEVQGSSERELRSFYAQSGEEQKKSNLQGYVEWNYLSRKPVEFEHTEPSDLSEPFRIRLDVGSVNRGVTTEEEAVVAIGLAGIAERLPFEFWMDPEAAADESRRSAGSRHRIHDYVFREPFITEWRYKIQPPSGFRPDELPGNEKLFLGPAILTTTFAVDDESVITATLRFDSGKRRISAEEFGLLRWGARELGEREPIFLRYKQVGMDHLAAGRTREAIEEFERLLALHPDKAHYRCLNAKALLRAGLGDAAEKAAREAIAIDAGSAYAYQTLGWALQHDSLGRRFGKGFDRAGAIDSYEQSKRLNPRDKVTRLDLAILLEHDGEGNRYGKEADLDAAIAEYKALREDLGDEIEEEDYIENLMLALMWAGRFEELRGIARRAESTPSSKQFALMATAVIDGTDAAIREGRLQLPQPKVRREAYERIGRTFMLLRRYPIAAELLSESAIGAPNSLKIRDQAALLLKARRYEQLDLSADDPTGVSKRFLVSFLLPKERERYPIHTIMVREVADELLEESSRFEELSRVMRTAATRMGMRAELLVDIMLAGLQLRVEGTDESGYRIRVLNVSPVGTSTDSYVVIKGEKGYRMLANSNLIYPLGNEVLRRVEGADVEGARILLNWAREIVSVPAVDDPLAINPFSRIWNLGSPPEPSVMRIAAGCLMAGSSLSEKAAGILNDGREGQTSETNLLSIDQSLAAAYLHLRNFEKALGPTNRLIQAHPNSGIAFQLRTMSLMGLKRYAAARRLAEERLLDFPDDPSAIRLLAQISADQGDWEAVDRDYRRLVAAGRAESLDYNNLAWNALFVGEVTDRAIDEARQAVMLSRQKSPSALHTLATLYAEVGRTTEAREAILQAIEISGREDPSPSDWYVLGRVAEHYGLEEAALDAYRKVTETDETESRSQSTYKLAQRRIRALGAKK